MEFYARACVFAVLLAILLLGISGTSQAQGNYIYNLTANPSSVIGGASSTGTVILSGAAGGSGQTITLSSNNTAATVPASVSLAPGQSSKTFTIATTSVTTAQTVTITATTMIYSYTSTKTMTFIVNPTGGGGGGGGGGGATTINSITLSPNSLVGGLPTQATVTLSAAAPTGGYTVNLTCSNNTAVAVGTNSSYVINATSFPTSTVVPAGQTTYSFYLNTSTVNYSQNFTVTAADTGNTTSANATLTLLPTNLRVTDYLMPNILRLVWNSASTQGYYTLVRSVMDTNTMTRSQSTTVATVPSSTTTYDDAFAFSNGTTYLYELFDTTASPPPATTLVGNNTRLSADMVTPYANYVTENQTVDSRIDLRYSTVHYQDFNFANINYRGGLFAGLAGGSDQSKVSRTFAKFTISAPPATASFRTGGVNFYYTGAPGNISNVPIGCQAIANNDWVGANLVWTLAPITTPGSATGITSFSWDKANPQPKYVVFNLANDVKAASLRAKAGGDARLSVAVGATDETSAGWVYFARSNYLINKTTGATAPAVATHVWDWAVPIRLFVCKQTIFPPRPAMPTTTWTFTVIVNGLNPGESASVTLNGMSFNSGVNVTSLINTFTGTTTGDFPPPVPTSATLDGVTVNAEPYPSGFSCVGGILQ